MPTVRLLPLLVPFALSCGAETSPEKSDSGGAEVEVLPLEVDWGSWQLEATGRSETEDCSEMGASAGSMKLYAELSVAEPDFIGVQLGARTLAGARRSEGFEASGEELMPPANPDGTGIFITLDAPEASLRAFSGELVYDLVSSRGHCTLVFDAVGEWMYYEPPPPCTG